jgi:uncharacterized membrane protein
MGAELSRILIAFGAVAAWSGIIVLGMGMAELVPSSDLMSKGQIVTVLGLVALVAGIVMYRATREPDLSGE